MTFRLDGCRLCRVHTPNSGITFLFPARRVKNGILFLVSLWVLPFVGVFLLCCVPCFPSLSLSFSLSLLSLSPFLFFFSLSFLFLSPPRLFFVSSSCCFFFFGLFLSPPLCVSSRFPVGFSCWFCLLAGFVFVLAQAPCCMSSFCDEFLSFLRSTSQQCGRRPVNVAFASLVKASWDILLKHALQLRDSFPRVRHLDNNGQRAFHTLKGALCDSVRFITAQTDFLSSPASDDASVPLCLKLGFGSPSTTGCLDAQGVTVKMRVLLRHPTSIQAAFANTGLHAIGLAGVRLPMDFRLPSDCGFRLISVGKADYNSVAVAFQTDFSSCFSKVDGIGSNRRLWLKVQPCSGRCFFWLVF